MNLVKMNIPMTQIKVFRHLRVIDLDLVYPMRVWRESGRMPTTWYQTLENTLTMMIILINHTLSQLTIMIIHHMQYPILY